MASEPAHQDHNDLSARREERKLVAYVRAGDVAAFEKLVKTYSENLVRFAAHRTGSWDAAQDIVQDIFVSIWSRHADWQVNNSLSAYLYRSVTHGIAKHARDHKVSVPVESAGIESGTQTDSSVNESEINAAAVNTLANLPEQTRTVFMLTRERKMSYSDTAGHLGVSVKTVEKHMSRALMALRRALKDWG